MATFLFDKIIVGPITSRRLGQSLGVNLLPLTVKYCNFDCIYCECGWSDNKNLKDIKFYKKQEVILELEKRLIELKNSNKTLDVITFAGNGEPTMHPEFAEIIDETIRLRNQYFPNVKVSVLSNSTLLHKEKVFEALKKVDKNIMKLDSGFAETINKINQPLFNYNMENVIEKLKLFNGKVYIQTMFLRSKNPDFMVDNTTEKEISAWLKALEIIKPEHLMIYSLDRETPANNLVKVSVEELNIIAERARNLGIEVIVGG